MSSRQDRDDLVRGANVLLAKAGFDIPAEVRGIGLENEDEYARAFGKMQDEEQTYSETDRGMTVDPETGELRRERLTDTKPIVMGEFVSADGRRKTEEPLGYEGEMAPKSALRDALNHLKQGSSLFGYRNPFMRGVAQAEGALEDHLFYGAEQRGAEQSLARELVKRDRNIYNPNLTQVNLDRAGAEAQAIARDLFTVGGAGAIGDANISRIPGPRGSDFSTAALVDGVYVDPTSGEPLAVTEPASTAVAGANTPNTSQQLNAPQRQSAVDWVASQVNPTEGYYAGTKPPQVDITGITTEFANRVRALEDRKVKKRGEVLTPFQGSGLSRVSSNIRSLDELEKVTDLILKLGAQSGITFPKMVQQPGGGMKAQATANPGVAEVMEFLKMPAAEQQRLAIALDSVAKAEPSKTKSAYMAREPFAQPSADIVSGLVRLPGKGQDRDMEVQVARAPSKRATEFRGLTEPGARQPFIGAVAGEEAPMSKTPGGLDERDTPDAFIRRQAADRAIENMKGREGHATLDEERIASNQARARQVREGAGAIAQEAQERRKVQALADRLPFMYGRRF